MISARTLLLAAITMFSAGPVSAQYGIPRGPNNLEVGYSYCVASATFKYEAKSFNEVTGVLKDTSFTQKVTSKGGFGAVGGYYWPVAKMSDKSRLAIAFSYMYNAYLWDGNAFSYSTNSQTGTESVGSGTVEMALPVGMDYKFGCDALKDKSERMCATFGAGIYPSMDATVYRDNGGFSFHMRPYVKAELGFFAGICFKVRATYVMGKINYFEYGLNQPGNFENTTFKSNSTLALSLIVMPFSWKWGRSTWW